MPDGIDRREIGVRRVLHVSPYIHPAAGGPPVVVERWAELAVSHGWRAHVLSTPALSPDDGQSLSRGAEGRYELSLVASALDTLRKAGRSKIRQLVRDADIIHLHTMWSPLNAIVAGVCRRNGKPYVVSPHGMLDPYSLGIKALRKRAYFKMIESRTIRGASSVLFTAADERDLAVAQIGTVPNPMIVGLGADTPDTSREALRARFRAAHPDLADKKLIVFLGRLHPKKRPEAAIRAMPAIRAKLPDAALLLVGGGQDGHVGGLKKLASELGVSDCVHFLGLLTGNEKWSALAASRVFVLPSLQENFAIAVAEALQVGLPVLITERINIWREIVDAGAGIALQERRLEEDLARHATALLSDQHRCRDMEQMAQALALRAYTWPISVQRLCAHYDTILESRKSAHAAKAM